MLLLDFSSVVVTAVMEVVYKQPDLLSMNTMRNAGLSEIIRLKAKWKKYGQPILCCDGGDYWRKDVFPLFKENRKVHKEKATVDWDLFYEYFDQFKVELAESFNYPIIHIPRIEADDIIAVLAGMATGTDVMVISSDKDMLQLQIHYGERIKQWSPQAKKLLTVSGNDYDLQRHFIKGDSGDGIPNIFSDDDTLMISGKRQKPVTTKFLAEFAEVGLPLLTKEQTTKYHRNVSLIDARAIPEIYRDQILAEFDVQSKPRPARVYTYLQTHRLRLLMRQIEKF